MTKPMTALKLSRLPGQPGVEVTLDKKTETDHRIQRLNTAHVLRTFLVDQGFRLESAEPGQWYVHGLANVNGADWNALGDHPSMIYYVPQGGASYPDRGAYLIDTVDGSPVEKTAALFERLVTKNRTAVLDLYSCTKLLKQYHQAVRFEGKTIVTDDAFQKAAAAVVSGRQPDLEHGVEGTLILTHSLDVAIEAVKLESFPPEAWVTVAVQHTLEPKARWHNERLTATDLAPIKRYAKEQARAAEEALEDDVAQYRAQLRLKGA